MPRSAPNQDFRMSRVAAEDGHVATDLSFSQSRHRFLRAEARCYQKSPCFWPYAWHGLLEERVELG